MQEREHFTLSHTLATILGVTGTGIDNLGPIPYIFKGDRVCDINREITAIYVHCNILKYVPVGKTKTHLQYVSCPPTKTTENRYIEFLRNRNTFSCKRKISTLSQWMILTLGKSYHSRWETGRDITLSSGAA